MSAETIDHSQQESKSALKKWLFRLLLFLFVIFLCLVVIEIFIRFLQYQRYPPSAVRQSDTQVHHSFRPNTEASASDFDWKTTYKINSLGMRDYPYSIDKPENTFRILMMGDSFTEGQGVQMEQTFVKLLETKLREKIKDKNIEVLNTGTLSYSPLLEYLYLKDRGLKLKPDLVVVNFDESDISDDLNYDAQAIKGEGAIPIGFPKIEFKDEGEPKDKLLPFLPKEFKKFMRVNVRLYQVVGDSIRSKELRIYPEIGNTHVTVGDPISDRLLLTRDDVKDFNNLWTLTERNLDLIKKLLDENKIALVVATYPYGHQVSTKEWAVGRKMWSLDNDKVYGDRAMQKVEELGKKYNFQVVNVLEDFQKSSQEGKFPLFFKSDGHFTPLGHEVMAQALEEKLLNLNLLPK